MRYALNPDDDIKSIGKFNHFICAKRSPSKNPDIKSPLVMSFFAGRCYSFFATSGVLMSRFFEGHLFQVA